MKLYLVMTLGNTFFQLNDNLVLKYYAINNLKNNSNNNKC
jgi:hypothetical protein